MADSILLSFIIPVYNAEKTLDRCFESLLGQSCSKFEAIFIDDGSTDNSLSKLKEFEKCFSFVKVIENNHGGVSLARNAGLECAKGDYITFLDSDDYISCDMVQEVTDIISNQIIDIVIFDIQILSQKRQAEWFYTASKTKLKGVKQSSMEQFFYEDGIKPFLVNKVFKKNLMENVKFLSDMKIGEDHFLLMKVFTRAKKLYYLNKSFYYYCFDNAQSAMSSGSKNYAFIADQHLTLCRRGVDWYLANFKNSKKDRIMLFEWVIKTVMNELILLPVDSNQLESCKSILDSLNLENNLRLGFCNRKIVKYLSLCLVANDINDKQLWFAKFKNEVQQGNNFPRNGNILKKIYFVLYSLSFEAVIYKIKRFF